MLADLGRHITAHAGRGNPFSPRMGTDSHFGLFRPPRNDRIPPARAARFVGCPLRESHIVVFPQPPSEAKLPSSGRGGCVRNAFRPAPGFSKISNRGLAISYEIGYTVCRVKRKAAVFYDSPLPKQWLFRISLPAGLLHIRKSSRPS